MNLSLYELRLILVVILCIPIVYFGIRFAGSLMDQALAGRKKSGSGGKKEDRRRYEDEEAQEQNDRERR